MELNKTSDSYKIYMNFDNSKGTDYDLNLKMKTKSGEECTVNASNPQCPYAYLRKDVAINEKGYEMIEVEKFVNAHYMVYVSTSPAYTGTCT